MDKIDDADASESGTHQKTSLLLLQVHLAEYQALTTRCTYWLVVEYGFYSVLAIYVALVGQIWNTMSHALLAWGSGVVVQLIELVWLATVVERYRATRYIERELRAMVRSLVEADSFWGYESHLARMRGAGNTLWAEYMPVVLTLVGLVLIAFLRHPLSREDYLWLALNVALFVCIVMMTVGVVRTRWDFFAHAA